jgi:glutathione S-transferase
MHQMTLYHTPTSPFARKARIVARERGVIDDITEIHAQIRTPQNEVLAISATGKVPALTVDEGPDKGLVLVESAMICEYLGQFGNGPSLAGSAPWPEKALDGYAHAFLDSIAWRGRDNRRPDGERSPGFVALEAERQRRCFTDLERRVDELAAAEISLGRILVAVALDFHLLRIAGEDWRPAHPRLADWHARMAARPSFVATTPF